MGESVFVHKFRDKRKLEQNVYGRTSKNVAT